MTDIDKLEISRLRSQFYDPSHSALGVVKGYEETQLINTEIYVGIYKSDC